MEPVCPHNSSPATHPEFQPPCLHVSLMCASVLGKVAAASQSWKVPVGL